MRKETQVLNENTTMTIEHTKGRCDIEITSNIRGIVISDGVIERVEKPHEEKTFYWIQFEGTEWVVRLCVNGFCYNTVELNRTYTKKEAIQTVIDRHTSQHCYDFGLYGDWFTTEFEVNLISKVIADYYQDEFEYVREYDGQHIKAYPNGYVFECDDIEVPGNTIKSEEEEAAAAEHFVKQMSEKGYFNGFYGKAVNQMSDAEPEYMGIDYTDARRFNNWQKLLLEKLYDGNTEHDRIYCITNYGKIFGWFWSEKGAEQFQRLYGGDMQEVDSDFYFISEIHDLFLEIICGVETDEISIESQLIEKGYLHKIENRPEYIFDTLLSYTYMFELQELILELKMKSYIKNIEKYLVLTRRDFLYKIKDPEKTILAFCKDMEFITERIIADYFKKE